MKDQRFSPQFATIYHRDLLIGWLVNRADPADIVAIMGFIDEAQCQDEELVSAIAVDTYVVYNEAAPELVAMAVLGCALKHSSTLNDLLAESVLSGLSGGRVASAFVGVLDATKAELTELGFDPDVELTALLDRYGLSNV